MAQQIAIQDLDVAQLAEVRKHLDDELKLLGNSFAQLTQANAKFKACAENVKEVEKGPSDKQILVPLTNSLYVPGKLANTKNVIVDVGTGYYVEKTTSEASTYYKAKITFLQSKLNDLQETLQRKQENMNVITTVMQQKLQEQQSP